MDFEAKKKKKSCKPLFHRNPESGRCVKNMTAEQRRLASRSARRKLMKAIRSSPARLAKYKKQRLDAMLTRRFGDASANSLAEYNAIKNSARVPSEDAKRARRYTMHQRAEARKAAMARFSGYAF